LRQPGAVALLELVDQVRNARVLRLERRRGGRSGRRAGFVCCHEVWKKGALRTRFLQA
jgi:hypothetical protein